jgi:copper homeostasis protein
MTVLVEACVDSLESALAAKRGGAQRLELCANLNVGGTTPSAGLIAEVNALVGLPIAAMIRPRGGSFVHTASEIEQMQRDIDMVNDVGVEALVFGVLDDANNIDVDTMQLLTSTAGGTPVVFHRAFDRLADQAAGLDALIALGIVRVLTSGGAATALDGAPALHRLVDRAAGRIEILAGGKVRGGNAATVVARSGVQQVHARCEGDGGEIRAIVDALAFAPAAVDLSR